MRNKIFASAAAMAVALVAFTAQAATYTLEPGIYDPDNTGSVLSYIAPDNSLHLEKNAPTATNSAAGANVDGVSGLSTTGLTLGFDVTGYCNAGSPRFNVNLTNGTTVFLGCAHGNDGSGNVSFTAGNTYGGVLFPTGQTVSSIQIIQDEQGQSVLSNATINGTTVTPMPQEPNKYSCKKGGFAELGFKNQGQCVSSFAKQK